VLQMKLLYFESSYGNFGDDLNPWLWSRLQPRLIDRENTDNSILLGIGTILNADLIGDKIAEASEIHVFGSGCGYAAYLSLTIAGHFIASGDHSLLRR